MGEPRPFAFKKYEGNNMKDGENFSKSEENHSDKDSIEGMGRRKFLITSGLVGAGLMGLPGVRKAKAQTQKKGRTGGDFDCVIVGSGINSLVCAALLANAGKRVCVLERNPELGGCIRTEELTLPGFKHDVLSSWHPLFVTSPAYGELKDLLHGKGLEYIDNDSPTAVLMPDNRSLILKRSRKENIKAMNAISKGDGDAYDRGLNEIGNNTPLTFGILGKNLWSYDFVKLLGTQAWDKGIHGVTSYFGSALRPCRTWLEKNFNSELCRAMLAPWVLHTGLGPDNALSGFMDKLIFFTLEFAGMPVVKGGSSNLVNAFVKHIESKNGVLQVNADVVKIITEGKEATGIKTSDGAIYTANEAVICNVTPNQLYEKLLDPGLVPAPVARQTREYRYGRGDMQIHIAMSEPPEWPDPALKKAATIHMTPGLDGVSRAVSQAARGLLPEEGTIVVGQPTALDPSRAPKGKWILWLQLQEVPRNGNVKGDALGKIEPPSDGKWNEKIAEQYADRIVDRMAKQIPNFKRAFLKRKVLSPADLERYNINLVGGDPYCGDCAIDQFFLWRPLRATKNHSTPVKGLFHIGASTHPGPGLGGGSGYLAAKDLI